MKHLQEATEDSPVHLFENALMCYTFKSLVVYNIVVLLLHIRNRLRAKTESREKLMAMLDSFQHNIFFFIIYNFVYYLCKPRLL